MKMGRTTYIKAQRTARPDVKEYYKQPGMPDPGYTAFIDVSAIEGKVHAWIVSCLQRQS